MSHTVVFSPEASANLQKIFDYVADRDSDVAAERFVRKIRDYCLGFDIFPERGIRRDDIRSGLRIVGFNRQATIAFTVGADVVTIAAIFYGGENYENTLPIGKP